MITTFTVNLMFLTRMDCLVKTVKSEGYFGMYRGNTCPYLQFLQVIVCPKVLYLVLQELPSPTLADICKSKEIYDTF